MKYDIVIAGVGGQGVLSMAAILAEAARRSGLAVKQGEVHGMAQRGGAVQATVRMSSVAVASELVPRGGADMVLGMEPIEALRAVGHLAPGGVLVTAGDPVTNIPDYPPIESVHRQVESLGGHLIEAARLAREAGSGRVANMVMIGAASALLPLEPGVLEECIREGFAPKGASVVEANLGAFRAGRATVPALGR